MHEPEATEMAQTANALLEAMIAHILDDQVSMLDFVRSAPEGDYQAFVQRMRLSRVLMQDRRVLEKMNKETRAKMTEMGGDPDDARIEQELVRKDAKRRFPKLLEERAHAVNTQPHLLTATTFDERLSQYLALIGHVEQQWDDACAMYQRGSFPLAAFLSILTVEEVGKLSRLAEELIYFDAPLALASPATIERSHRKKHFIGVVSGALINARLDRVLGKDKVRKILHEAESDELEKTRQACLYVDTEKGRTVTPAERISEARAQDLTVLAGELLAEVLGHFPWQFERMIERVVAFERNIGLPEKKIERK